MSKSSQLISVHLSINLDTYLLEIALNNRRCINYAVTEVIAPHVSKCSTPQKVFLPMPLDNAIGSLFYPVSTQLMMKWISTYQKILPILSLIFSIFINH